MASTQGDWRDRARSILKTYYQSFSGVQWHEFDLGTDKELLQVKICYALHGPPTVQAKRIEEAYTDEQKNGAQQMINNIEKVKREDGNDRLNIGFAFVVCHQEKEDKEFPVPVVSVLVGTQNGDERNFVDAQGRIYKSWSDWKENNALPKVKIAYPKGGYFTCRQDGAYGYDAQADPVIEFGESPQCGAWATTKTVGDIVGGVTSLGCAAVGVASLFTPIGPVVLLTSAVVGGVSATYGAARGVGALVDKGTHGESLHDLESLMLWFSIAATPFHFATTAVTGILAKGAVQQGRIFSQGARVFASVLLCTTFGLDSALITLSLVNLIKKFKDDELTTLDVVQFSVGVFFFSNTLIQPKTANGVISKAQSMHFDKMGSSMSDGAAKETFNKFLADNKVDGSIKDRSKIVRTINRMDDPNKFFNAAGKDPSIDAIKIGGRKGKTVMISDQHGYGQRVKPNEFQSIGTSVLTQGTGTSVQTSDRLQKQVKQKVRRCFDQEPADVDLNGEKIFEGLDDLQKGEISRKLGGTAKHNPDIAQTAFSVAERMGCKTLDEYLSVVELVANEVKGMTDANISSKLQSLDQATFIQNLKVDLARAKNIASKGGLNFQDPYKAVYHYRKHGEEFPKFSKRHGNALEFYLGPTKNHVIDRANLREAVQLQNGDMKYIYATRNDEFGIVIANQSGGKVSTIFKNPGCFIDHPRRVVSTDSTTLCDIPPASIPEIAELIATNLGLPTFQVLITVNKERKSVESVDMDPSQHEAIANLLVEFNRSL